MGNVVAWPFLEVVTPNGNTSDMGREIGAGSSVDGVIILMKGSSDSIWGIHDGSVCRVLMVLCFTTQLV